MTPDEKVPVADWATDFDHTHPDYAAKAPEVWDELRQTCPVAHTERFGGAWLPVRHADVTAIAHDTEHFSSEFVIVNPYKPDGSTRPRGFAPPITSDPPFHHESRRILLPAFSPREIDKWEPATRKVCNELLDDTAEVRWSTGQVRGPRQLPVRIAASTGAGRQGR